MAGTTEFPANVEVLTSIEIDCQDSATASYFMEKFKRMFEQLRGYPVDVVPKGRCCQNEPNPMYYIVHGTRFIQLVNIPEEIAFWVAIIIILKQLRIPETNTQTISMTKTVC